MIYSFWYSVFYHTEELTAKISALDITLETWHYMSKFKIPTYCENESIVNIGLAGLFLNRTNFSGILKGGPLGGMEQKSKYKIDCRFNKEAIVKNIEYYSLFKDKIEVYNYDAIEFMQKKTKYKRNSKLFVYIDPPYYNKGKSLYRYYYTDSNHQELANYIKNKSFPWLISYDATPFIEDLYKKNNKINLYLDYSAKTSKKGKELLISNLKIPPIENQLCFINNTV